MTEAINVSVTVAVTDVAGWKVYQPSGAAYAICPTDPLVEVRVIDGVLRLTDEENYYPSGHYVVPLAVIEFLGRLDAGDEDEGDDECELCGMEHEASKSGGAPITLAGLAAAAAERYPSGGGE